MNYLVQVFAGIFARFKQKNPAVAGIIALVCLAVIYTALGVFALPQWAADAVKWLGTFVLAVNGASTHQFENIGGWADKKE
jgi:threonine/homoserine/homoserine lactone efflux protein